MQALEREALTFNQLKGLLKTITSKVLAERLRDLLTEQLIELKDNQYQLTQKGKEFGAILQATKEWSAKYGTVPKTCPGKNCVDCIQGSIENI